MKLNKESKVPLYQQLAKILAAEILSGQRPDKSLLMPERTMAEALGVHRNTVMKAYNLLKDWQLIEGRGGSGHYVTYAQVAPFCHDEKKSKYVNWQALLNLNEANDISDLDRYYERPKDHVISFAIGSASPQIFGKTAEQMVAKIACTLPYKEGGTSYSGSQQLVSALVGMLKNQGISCNKANIQVLYEINQAMDFLSAILIQKGDAVLIEEPVSPDVYRAFKNAGAKLIPLPTDEDGLITNNLEPAIIHYEPKMLVVSTGVSDPTGSRLSLKRRQQLADISYKYGLMIVEDNTGDELSWGKKLPPLKSFCPENVIYIKSFGLTFLPAMPLAVVCGNRLLMERLAALVSERVLSINWLSQQVLAESLEKGQYEKWVKHQRRNNKQQMEKILGLIEADQVLRDALAPQDVGGGCYLWIKINEKYLKNSSVQSFVHLAKKKGLLILDGQVFYFSQGQVVDSIRLCFSTASDGEIEKGIEILKETIIEIGKLVP